MEWYWVLLIVLGSLLILLILSIVFYRHFFKRFYDIVFSGIAIILLSPLFLILVVAGSIAMRGNPFFTQKRPGKNEKIFKLLKFRSMDNRKDENGNLLPDDIRLNKYGRFIRKTSLDELPELFNIFIGDMSIVGPRPLLVEYLPWYTEKEHHRHGVRPGLTGLAQIKGRNNVDWDRRLAFDLEYVSKITLFVDFKIVCLTFLKVFKRDGISENTNKTEGNFADIRKRQSGGFKND